MEYRIFAIGGMIVALISYFPLSIRLAFLGGSFALLILDRILYRPVVVQTSPQTEVEVEPKTSKERFIHRRRHKAVEPEPDDDLNQTAFGTGEFSPIAGLRR